jgi:hypothetical protein
MVTHYRVRDTVPFVDPPLVLAEDHDAVVAAAAAAAAAQHAHAHTLQGMTQQQQQLARNSHSAIVSAEYVEAAAAVARSVLSAIHYRALRDHMNSTASASSACIPSLFCVFTLAAPA